MKVLRPTRIMLKIMALLGVFLGLFAVDMAYHQKASAQQHTEATQDGPPAAITVNNDDHSSQKHQEESHVAPWWPEGITAIAIICTLIAIGIQTYYTRKAAEASTASATAALDQANHMITSERAWIIVSSRFPEELSPNPQRAKTRFRWEFLNVGKSPARLIEFNGVARRGDRFNISFPEPAPFFRDRQLLNKLLLVPTDSWGLTWEIEGNALSAAEFDVLKRWEQLTIVSYGYIKYLDVFGKEHTTNFCQETWFDKKDNKIWFPPKIEAPASYTACD